MHARYGVGCRRAVNDRGIRVAVPLSLYAPLHSPSGNDIDPRSPMAYLAALGKGLRQEGPSHRTIRLGANLDPKEITKI